LGALGELGTDAGDAFVPDDLIEPEAYLLGLWVRWCSMVCSLVLTRAYRIVAMNAPPESDRVASITPRSNHNGQALAGFLKTG